MLICVIVPRNIRRKFLAGFLTGFYGQSDRCDRVRVGRSVIYVIIVLTTFITYKLSDEVGED